MNRRPSGRRCAGWPADCPSPLCWPTRAKNGRDYLLTERLKAVSAADGALLDDPDRLLVLLSGARALRDVDLGGCPLPDATGASCAPQKCRSKAACASRTKPFCQRTGSTPPASLLGWLETHRPKEHAVFTHGDCCLPNLFF